MYIQPTGNLNLLRLWAYLAKVNVVLRVRRLFTFSQIGNNSIHTAQTFCHVPNDYYIMLC